MAWLDQRFGSANPAVKIFSPRLQLADARDDLPRARTAASPFLVGDERPQRLDPGPPLDLLAGQEIARR